MAKAIAESAPILAGEAGPRAEQLQVPCHDGQQRDTQTWPGLTIGDSLSYDKDKIYNIEMHDVC